MRERPPAHPQGVGGVRQAQARVLPFQTIGEAVRHPFQGGGRARREQQHLPGARRAGRSSGRSFLKHRVHVGAADAERAHPGAAGLAVRLPVGQAVGHPERARGEVDGGVRRREVQAGRDLAVLQGEHRLDQAGDAGRRVQVADVGLDRAEEAVPGAAGPPPGGPLEGQIEGGDLDGIAQGCRGAVRLDVGDALRRDPGVGERRGDDTCLPGDARRGVARLAGAAVVVGRRAEEDGVDGVAVRQRVCEPLEHDDAGAAPPHRAARRGVEGAAAAVGRGDAPLLVEIAGALRQADGHAAGQRHVAGAEAEVLARQVDRHQRAGAGRLDGQAGPREVQFVRDAGGQEVLVVAQQELEPARCRLGVAGEDLVQVVAEPQAGEHADRPRHAQGVVAGVLQRLPGTFEEHALLGIQELGLARAVAEEAGVEQLHAVEHPGGRHVAGIAPQLGSDAGGGELLVAEAGDRGDAGAQVGP